MIQQEIIVRVSFAKHTLIKKDLGVVEGDYNTTKLIFEFEEDVSNHRIVFNMSNSQSEIILRKDLVENEVVLAGGSEGNMYSLFTAPGQYPFELVLYGDDGKLTSAPGWLNVNKRNVPGEGESVLDDAYSAGKQEAYDQFWDKYQDCGNRKQYNYGFAGVGWNDETFNPKYGIKPTTMSNMFSNAGITDLRVLIENRGINLNCRQATNITNLFYKSKVTHLPELDFTNATSLQNVFMDCEDLVSIEKIILPSGAITSLTQMFMNCSNLEHVIFEGQITRTSFSVQWSPKLTHDSLMSIINALMDNTGNSATYIVTLGSENLAKLTTDEINIARNKNWSVK